MMRINQVYWVAIVFLCLFHTSQALESPRPSGDGVIRSISDREIRFLDALIAAQQCLRQNPTDFASADACLITGEVPISMAKDFFAFESAFLFIEVKHIKSYLKDTPSPQLLIYCDKGKAMSECFDSYVNRFNTKRVYDSMHDFDEVDTQFTLGLLPEDGGEKLDHPELIHRDIFIRDLVARATCPYAASKELLPNLSMRGDRMEKKKADDKNYSEHIRAYNDDVYMAFSGKRIPSTPSSDPYPCLNDAFRQDSIVGILNSKNGMKTEDLRMLYFAGSPDEFCCSISMEVMTKMKEDAALTKMGLNAGLEVMRDALNDVKAAGRTEFAGRLQARIDARELEIKAADAVDLSDSYIEMRNAQLSPGLAKLRFRNNWSLLLYRLQANTVPITPNIMRLCLASGIPLSSIGNILIKPEYDRIEAEKQAAAEQELASRNRQREENDLAMAVLGGVLQLGVGVAKQSIDNARDAMAHAGTTPGDGLSEMPAARLPVTTTDEKSGVTVISASSPVFHRGGVGGTDLNVVSVKFSNGSILELARGLPSGSQWYVNGASVVGRYVGMSWKELDRAIEELRGMQR